MNFVQQNRRQAMITGLLLAGFVGCGWKLFGIQFLHRAKILAESRDFIEFNQPMPALRGEILARDGTVLALSENVEYVYLNPLLCTNRVPQIVQTCAPILGMTPGQLQAIVEPVARGASNNAPGSKRPLFVKVFSAQNWKAIQGALTLESFGYDVAHLKNGQKAQLQQLRTRLFITKDVQVRRYPWLAYAPRVTGFAWPDLENESFNATGGVEQSCDKFLAGSNGCYRCWHDAAGNELAESRVEIRQPTNGGNVVLTIDPALQQSTQEIVEAARTRCQAKSASAIVLDARTAEILSMATAPGYDASAPADSIEACWRNPVFMDEVEPGSTFKIIVLAALLEQGRLNLDSDVYCENGRFVVNHVVVNDHEPLQLLTVRDSFARSSNIAFSKFGLNLGPERLYDAMINFGFGRRTGMPFISEASGSVDPPTALNWKTTQLTRAAFGQGFHVTQLQMAMAASVIANDGRLMRPTLVGQIESPRRRTLWSFQPVCVRQVISPEIAALVKEAMKSVAGHGGTGAKVAMSRYTVAVKTGTAQKANKYGYIKGAYYSSMVGFFPADSPRLVISVALDEPRAGYYASDVASPAFKSLCEAAAARYQIPPDKITAPAPGNHRSGPAHGALASTLTGSEGLP